MELIQYIRLFRRWAWMLLLAAFIGGSVSFITRSSATPVYSSETKIAIGSFIQSPNPSSGEISIGRDLAQTYAELIRTHDVLQSTVDALSLPMSPGALRSIISTRIIANTSLLVVTVRYSDPVMAADIANELARQLIMESPTNLTSEQQAQIDIANDQIHSLRTELNSLRIQLEAVTNRIESTGDAEERDRLTEQRNVLINQINESSANIASFSNNIANLQQRTNSLEIVETARISGTPVGTSTLNATVLGAMVGVALAAGGVLLIEYLNDTFRSSDEVVQTLSIPVLGVISRFGKKKEGYHKKLITNDLFSRIPEEYRTLRTNLLFATDQDRERPFLVTSASPEEGKSITAANLAISMALAEMRVLLIDADLRRPRVHDIFGLSNNLGLTTLLSNPPLSRNGSHPDEEIELVNNSWMQCIQQTGIPNLQVITSGFMPKNPAEMLGSTHMTRWLQIIRRALKIDAIIIDTPPCLVVSDSMVLSVAVKAQVLLVIEAGRTRRTAAIKAKERFNNINLEVAGAILNGTNIRDEDYYGYYTYYYQSDGKQKKSNKVPQT